MKVLANDFYEARLKSICRAVGQHHGMKVLVWKFVIIKGKHRN